MGSSPYSTGGGGVRLEQEFAASALASLLLAGPVEGLGDVFTPFSVGLQQERHAPVDDVVVHGRAPDGERALRIACRRRPTIGKSDDSTIKLFADYVQMVLENAPELEAGTLRLGLAVAGPFGPAEEVADLAEVARRQDGRTGFDAALAAPGAYAADVKRRLTNVDELVVEALKYLNTPESRAADPQQVTWRLLRSLFVLQTQFEGDAAPGRTHLVARLQTLTGETAGAEALRLRLIEIAAQGAIRAGAFTRPMLRRELRPWGGLGASPDFGLARAQMELLEDQLRQRTHRSLFRPGSEGAFVLDRSAQEEELAGVIAGASPEQAVIVRGEPDVGKSALALATVERIRGSGGATLAMSLRDLPAMAVELRGALGLGPVDLLAAAPSAPVSALLLDGAEVVQEGSSGALSALLAAACEAGTTPVLVVRDDAAGSLKELISEQGWAPPLEFVVAPLTNTEITEVAAAIPALAQLAGDARAVWLLRRLGLVELLLRAAEGGSKLPRSLSSEAEVFATVWSSLVRRSERMLGTVSPDDRDAALTGVARRLVTHVPATVVPGATLTTLRSDGLLLSRGRKAAWEGTDSFASDVLRDFATARLLLGDGLELLVRSSGPRWAIRAAKLYAQARLSAALEEGPELFREEWVGIRSEFAALAAMHGPRWAEVPWEALLSAGWAPQALAAISDELLSKPSAQDEIMRCVQLRFSPGGVTDAMVAAPVVAWFVETAHLFGVPRSYREDPVGKLVLAWLHAVALEELTGAQVAEYAPLRRRIRDELLAASAPDEREDWLESLALMGSDSNAASDEALRAAARDNPERLVDVVEAPDAAMLLARRDADLLAELAEAYYIEPEMEPSPWGGTLLDEGIRDHVPSGLLQREAGPYRGPFQALLRIEPSLGLAVIDHMLARAARTRVEASDGFDDRVGHAAAGTGHRMGLLGLEPRWYVGDSHVWYWYRGSAVGPYPCVSALLALEIVMDEMVAAGLHLRNVATWLLRNATTLATPGVLYGFLVRHIERVTDELDDFLADPEVWELEFARLVPEGRWHIQGRDPEDLVGRERRKWTPATVAGHLVVTAAQQDDHTALERLRSVGRRLLVASGGEEATAQARQWAAGLDWDSYVLLPHEKGYTIEVKLPADVEEQLTPARAESNLTMRMYGLMNRYRLRALTPYRWAPADLPDDTQVAADLEAAQDVGDHLANPPLDQLRTALGGLAAALVHAALNGRSVDTEQLRGAVDLLVDSATLPYLGDFPSERSVSPDGADRKAALVLPEALLLTARFADDGSPLLGDDGPQETVEQAIRAGSTSLFMEVRANAAEGLRALLDRPCGLLPDGRCWHEAAWQAIDAGSRSIVLGKPKNGSRVIESLGGDPVERLPARPDRDLMLSHIAPVAASVLYAAAAPSCIQDRALRLAPALLDAYGRAARIWAERNYRWPLEQQAPFASAVLRSNAAWDGKLVLQMADRLRDSPAALAQFLSALTLAATYEAENATALGAVWPELMQLGLEAARERSGHKHRRSGEELLRELVPSPTGVGAIEDVSIVIERAGAHWLPLEAIAEHVDTWLSLGQGQRQCVDALVGMLRTQPLSRQADPGLDWVRRLVVREDGIARTSGFLLVEWLEALRESKALGPTTWPKYRAVVDALVLGNYRGARDLQRRDE